MARFAGVLAVCLLLGAAGAQAKDFGPGDLRVCGAARCIPVVKPTILPLLGSFYYGGPQPATVRAPKLGAPAFQLRFKNGYVTGIVATAKLDRFLSYGVYVGRFVRGKWYRVPPRMSAELRRLAASLEPLR